jgi:hypothetical protein
MPLIGRSALSGVLAALCVLSVPSDHAAIQLRCRSGRRLHRLPEDPGVMPPAASIEADQSGELGTAYSDINKFNGGPFCALIRS